MAQIFFLCFICLLSSLDADNSYWNDTQVRSYVHNSELQRRWAWSFLGPHLKHLNDNEQILDIGCGDGRISADIAKFVPQGSVTGIDPSTSMLAWAKKQYHPLEYPNLTFQEGGFLNPNTSQSFDLIVSFCALQHCPDQQAALSNLKTILKPGGKILILVPAMDNPAWNLARNRTQSSAKWSTYWQHFTPRKFLTPERYTELLKSAGFLPIKVELIKTADPFVDRLEIVDWLLGTFAPVVPAALARDFYHEWVDTYLELNPEAVGTTGVIYAAFGFITIDAILADNVPESP